MRFHYWIVKLTMKILPNLFLRYYEEYEQVYYEREGTSF